MRKLIRITIKTFIFIISIKIISIILILCSNEFIFLNINDNNKNKIIELLEKQEGNMFNINKKLEMNYCYNNLERVEMIFIFPHSKEYRLYCKDEQISFSLNKNNTDSNLDRYIADNGHKRFRIKKF